MVTIRALTKLAKAYSCLADVSIDQISTFVRIAALLKRNILLVQPIEQSNPDVPPKVLSDSIAQFLSAAIGVDIATGDILWECIREEVWSKEEVAPISDQDLALFRKHHDGWPLGISKRLSTFIEHVNTTLV